MLEFTEAAKRKLVQFARGMEQPCVRITAGGAQAVAGAYPIALELLETDDLEEAHAADVVFQVDELTVRMAPEVSLPDDAVVEYVESDPGAGFRAVPAGKAAGGGGGAPDSPLAERVQQVIDEQLNPALAGHGGFVTMVGLEDNVVLVELGGGCQGCGMARVTLKQGVERMIREAVPEVAEVRDVTDHSGGQNPYFGR